MADYRTPAENRAAAAQDKRIQAVLAQAVRDGASLFAAARLGEPEDVVELWVDRVWNGLRDGLIDRKGFAAEDRLAAIVFLLTERMRSTADAMLQPLGEVDA